MRVRCDDARHATQGADAIDGVRIDVGRHLDHHVADRRRHQQRALPDAAAVVQHDAPDPGLDRVHGERGAGRRRSRCGPELDAVGRQVLPLVGADRAELGQAVAGALNTTADTLDDFGHHEPSPGGPETRSTPSHLPNPDRVHVGDAVRKR